MANWRVTARRPMASEWVEVISGVPRAAEFRRGRRSLQDEPRLEHPSPT